MTVCPSRTVCPPLGCILNKGCVPSMGGVLRAYSQVGWYHLLGNLNSPMMLYSSSTIPPGHPLFLFSQFGSQFAILLNALPCRQSNLLVNQFWVDLNQVSRQKRSVDRSNDKIYWRRFSKGALSWLHYKIISAGVVLTYSQPHTFKEKYMFYYYGQPWDTLTDKELLLLLVTAPAVQAV